MRYSSSSRNSKRNGRSSNDRAEICEQTLYASWYTDSRVVIRRSVGTKGTAEAQVGVSWPEPLIIASIVVVNVAALCRKWPVNITAVPFTKPARLHRPAKVHWLYEDRRKFRAAVASFPRFTRFRLPASATDLRASRLAANPTALHSPILYAPPERFRG